MPRLLVFAALLLTFAAVGPALGPVMHDNDQASLLFGVLRLARGVASPWAADFYNYDKQFATYWLLAAARAVLPRVDVVALGNVFSFVIFWGGVVAAVLRGRVRGFAPAAGLVTCVLAPAAWLHSPFLGTSSVSAGFFLLAWAAWPRAGGNWPRKIAALLLVALAVGCRADAVLILPWFFWTVTPAGTGQTLRRKPMLYLLASASGLALLAGRVIFSGTPVDGYPPFFYPKIYAAYLVFGLGAATGVLAWVALGLLATARSRQRARRTTAAFYLLGLLALLLPWAFYSVQLFTTRYWTPLLCALLVGLLSPRGRVLLAWPRHRHAARAGAIALVAGALALVLVGVHLPFATRPRLVLTEPTVFPTGDGRQPMGAMLSFLRQVANNPDHVVDHNQAIWLAAARADLRPDETGRVPILTAPLDPYLKFAAELKGRESRSVELRAPAFYADARDLLRTFATPDRLHTADRREVAAQLRVRAAGPAVAGYEIVRHERDGATDPAWTDRLVIAQALDGNEYQLRAEFRARKSFTLPRRDAGKSVVLFSREAFAVELVFTDGRRQPVAVQTTEPGALRVAVLAGAAWDGASFAITAGAPAVAVTVFPDYMSIRRL
jgi:hypothetical protein